MAIYPKIQGPCPYMNNLAAIMDGDMCRLCKRQVFDITHLGDAERVAFFKGCSGEVCVSYKARPAIAAAVLAMAFVAAPMAASACDDDTSMVVVVGGMTKPANVQFVSDPADAKLPAIPVVYDDKSGG